MSLASPRTTRGSTLALSVRATRVLFGAFSAVGLLATIAPAASAPTAVGEPVSASTHSAENAGCEVASYFRPEVRLRKLHLVRPDLIPYPIAFEVYC